MRKTIASREGRLDSTRHRKKISITVDPTLLGSVDAFLADHPDYDRSAVFDEAMYLWYARQQDRAMEAQYAATPSEVEVKEHEAWGQIQAEAAKRLFGRD